MKLYFVCILVFFPTCIYASGSMFAPGDIGDILYSWILMALVLSIISFSIFTYKTKNTNFGYFFVFFMWSFFATPVVALIGYFLVAIILGW